MDRYNNKEVIIMPVKFRLKVLLAQKGMTQKELAQITGIRAPTISAICNGTIKEIPVGVLSKICIALGCQPGNILEYEDETQG
jgi:putative transcriptional regulator